MFKNFYKYEKSNKIFFTDKILQYILLWMIPNFITPNYFTILRFFLTPFVLYFIYLGNFKISLVLFLVTSLTDAIDGALARTRDQITKWGKIYDPAADKFLILGVIFLTLFKVDFVLSLTILITEVLIVSRAFWGYRKKKKDLQANWWGKSKMMFHVLGVSFLILGFIINSPILIQIAIYCFYISVILGIISSISYGI